MKRRVVAMMLVLMMVLSVTAMAVTPRAALVMPRLSFSGTTAMCEVDVFGDADSDSISVTLALWHNGNLVTSWYRSGTGTVSIDEDTSVIKGQTYTLTATAKVNGNWLDTMSVEGTC